MLTVAIIGLGNRGRMYVKKFADNGVKVNATCEVNERILKAEADKYNVPEEFRFTSDTAFFAKGKLADCLIIATQDRDHYGHAVSALNAGYNILLEKPVSPDFKQCQEIASLAEKTGLKVVVCHVLRYSAWYNKVKETLDSGAIGDIVNINHTENIGYWHYSHSYVRGSWRKEAETSPSILAKCCHDLDIIYYFTGAKAKSLYASGSRNMFIPENCPEGASDRCISENGECKHRKTCPYDVAKIYYKATRYTLPLCIYNWEKMTGDPKPTKEKVINVLKTTSPYGRCVWKCDNDVMENQVVSMKLARNITATLTMTAFSKWCFRRLHIVGTKGEIIGDDFGNKFKVNRFGGKTTVVKVRRTLGGHLGGDDGVVKEFIDYVVNGTVTPRLTVIADTLESHQNAIASEKARKENTVITF